MQLSELAFWGGFLVLVYTYFAYPVLLWLVTRFTAKAAKPESENHPAVTLVIAAFNESKVIDSKISNSLSLDYPPDKLDILIASDGSTDGTNEIVSSRAKESPRIKFLPLPRGGKYAAVNAALNSVVSEIVVFSDANTIYDTSAIRRLVRHFSEGDVGCVCGRLSYNNPGQVISGKGESAYWRYETALKKMESQLGYVAGANGAIYAIRRELFSPLPKGTINDDFMISMRIVAKGYKCLYDETAIAYEEVAPDVKSEFRRHVRDGAGHYLAVWRLAPLLNPFLGLRSLIYWSHRIFRWSAPFILVALFVLNVLLANESLYRGLLVTQILFYSLALLGYAFSHYGRAPFFMYVPFYFSNLNLALFFGFMKVVTGRMAPTWQSTQR